MRELIIYFTIYSFLGWLSETIYCYIIDKKFTYRGFLYGPVCPIYGFGGIIVTECLRGMKGNIIEVFFGGMILASILEYITSYVLQKLFNMKWWDYSEHKFNINGRVCLLNSTMFGILAVVIVYVLEPLCKNTVVSIPHKILYPLSAVITTVFIVDTIFTVAHLIHLREHLASLTNIKDELKELNIKLESFGEAGVRKLKQELEKRKGQNNDRLEKLLLKLDNLKKEGKESNRILKAFPHAKHTKHHNHLKDLKSLINGK